MHHPRHRRRHRRRVVSLEDVAPDGDAGAARLHGRGDIASIDASLPRFAPPSTTTGT
jgi:hypothetical protein